MNFVLDADIRGFYEAIDHEDGRAPDRGQEGAATDPEMDERRVMENGTWTGCEEECGSNDPSLLAEHLPAPCPRPVGPAMEEAKCAGEVIITRAIDDPHGRVPASSRRRWFWEN